MTPRVDQDELKRTVALAAVDLVAASLDAGQIVGVGTGSTTNHFIDALAKLKDRFGGAVSSSVASAQRLAAHGVRVVDLNEVDAIAVYVDGADEVEPGSALVKGGGGAHTREKIVAAAADRFICIVDESKVVDELGAFGVPVEVVPMARRSVAARLRALGGDVRERRGFVTDNGNAVLDLHGLAVTDPDGLEARINNLAGVVENGIFAVNRPDLVLVGSPDGVREIAP
ncbi:MAG: ribose-5-phosphate isomerase RpiA [Gammaproteobacteria bacterium]|nr:ribose-5-phosphate isomerase RpiA [Gammaproteobacteria bacterium]MXY55740.1 ribose-5-phosphate isomerase RpiA [Gammaproteobacteria bacterium]MYF28653.1 ribose-5-phosphate isomerase RpiA [Gammaproteobacteria bacterium]MYK45006.1 ribose-5-phosphate isomerase RpiA [Gammaproteobacteria bacterium]